MTTIHVYPENDLVEHETDGDDCICGPVAHPVESEVEAGVINWVSVHNALDGRELGEQGREIPKEN